MLTDDLLAEARKQVYIYWLRHGRIPDYLLVTPTYYRQLVGALLAPDGKGARLDINFGTNAGSDMGVCKLMLVNVPDDMIEAVGK